MKIIISLKAGAGRTVIAWKNILVVWFAMLMVTTLAVSPLKGILYSGFGTSMIVEKLSEGLNIEAFLDLGTLYNGVIAGFGNGFLTLILFSFLINTFFTGGLFDCIRNGSEPSVKEFMRACVRNFWSFILITFISVLSIVLISLIVFVIPILFVDMEGDHVELVIYRTIVMCLIIFLLFLPVLLLVADYARAWKAANTGEDAFKALGKGFSLTFGNFASSWGLMLILILINALFLFVVLKVLPGITPESGGGIFQLFLLSQALFIIKLALKLYRYSCVTSLMETKGTEEY